MKLLDKLAFLTASGLGSGFSPKAPGTAGSLTCFVLWHLLAAPFLDRSFYLQLLLLFVVTFLGLISSKICLISLAGEGKPSKDPQFIVIDEWAGLLVALLGVHSQEILFSFVALLLFRFFDIIKPGPVAWAEKLPEHWGIMLDDLVAGCFAAIVLWLIRLVLVNLPLSAFA